MDRRGFLRRGTVTAAVVAVAPIVAVKAMEAVKDYAILDYKVTFSPARLEQVIAVSNGGWYYEAEAEIARKMMLELERQIWFGERKKSEPI